MTLQFFEKYYSYNVDRIIQLAIFCKLMLDPQCMKKCHKC